MRRCSSLSPGTRCLGLLGLLIFVRSSYCSGLNLVKGFVVPVGSGGAEGQVGLETLLIGEEGGRVGG